MFACFFPPFPSVGGHVKSWKRRWFFLDVYKRELRYYQSPKVSLVLQVSVSTWHCAHHRPSLPQPQNVDMNEKADLSKATLKGTIHLDDISETSAASVYTNEKPPIHVRV